MEYHKLTREEIERRVASHHAVLADIVRAHHERQSRREKHPVHDFLFTYYTYPAGKLLQWTPAWDEALPLGHPLAEQLLQKKGYGQDGDFVRYDLRLLTEKERERIQWIHGLLCATRDRTPQFGCYGLHEWAMVYKNEDQRHEDSPLRLPQTEVDALLTTQTVACSHFDAFRFFTPSAKPLNVLQPTRDDQPAFEQAGCIHANLDLYKWAYKLMPWAGADRLRDAFEVAWQGREIDMRASPYDLREYGYTPILIETEKGRAEYVAEQKSLTARAAPVRSKLIELCQTLLQVCA